MIPYSKNLAKETIRGAIGNDIDNFYQVCAKARKSVNGVSCSQFVKGTEEDLENLIMQLNGKRKKCLICLQNHYLYEQKKETTNPKQYR